MSLRCVVFLFFLPFASLNCKQEKERENKNMLNGYVYVSRQNEYLTWANSSISVCWESSDSDREVTLKQNIQHKVVSAYENTPVRFSGWKACADTLGQIRVSLDPKAQISHVKAFGRNLDGIPSGIVFNFDPLKQIDERLLAVTSIHEFGHALGLAHEMNRPDNNGKCDFDQTYGQGFEDAYMVGKYDEFSIMNYCFNEKVLKENSTIGLSSDDINVLRMLYQTNEENMNQSGQKIEPAEIK
jgi:hypothetical protein